MQSTNKNHTTAQLLAEAVFLAKQEKIALSLETADKVEELLQCRKELIKQALEQKEGYRVDLLLADLQELQELQEDLIKTTLKEQSDITKKLQQRKSQTGYFKGARYQSAQDEKAFFLKKIS